MAERPAEFESILDRECVICGGEIPSNHPRQKTCSRECREKMTLARRRAYRVGLAVPIYRPEEKQVGPRLCADCRAPLSAYNRGRFCHPCWRSYSLRARNRIGGDR